MSPTQQNPIIEPRGAAPTGQRSAEQVLTSDSAVFATGTPPRMPGIASGHGTYSLGERLLIGVLFAACAIFLFLLLRPIFHNLIFTEADLLIQDFPARKFYADALHTGNSFLWWPSIYGGYYLQGEGQAGMTHPWHLVLYYLLPLKVAFDLEIFSSYVFLLVGCYYLLRRWKLSVPAALFGAFLFTFSDTNLDLLSHLNAVAVTAHLPWLLLAIDRAFFSDKAATRALWLAPVAALVASEVLIGFPQYVYFSAVAAGGYCIYLMACDRRWLRFTEIAGAMTVGLLLGAVQLVPTMAALKNSVRIIRSTRFLSDISLHPLELLQWANPMLWLGHHYDQLRSYYNYEIYCGGIVTLLLFVWILGQREIEARRRILIRFLGVLAAVSLLLSLGKYNGLFPLYSRLPLLGLFRGPARYMVLAEFAISVGAALALDGIRFLGGYPRISRTGKFSIAAAALVVVAVTVVALILQGSSALGGSALGSWAGHTHHLWTPPRILFGGAVTLLGILLFFAAGRFRQISYPMLAVFVVAEVLLIQGWPLAHQKIADPFQILNRPPIAAPGPIQTSTPDDSLTLLGYHVVNGWSGLEPASATPMQSSLYARIMGARAVEDANWSAVANPLPLVRLRHDAVLIENGDEVFRKNAEVQLSAITEEPLPPLDVSRDLPQFAHFDFLHDAIVETPVQLDHEATGTLTLSAEQPGRLRLVSEATGTSLATLGVRYDAGWQVWLDGRRQESLRVDGNLLGFTVPAGPHTIECKFDPPDFRHGLWISLCTLLGICVYLAFVCVIQPMRDSRATAAAL